MAYTIQFSPGAYEKRQDTRNRVLLYLQERLAKDGKFRCNLQASTNRGLGGYICHTILVAQVRLVKAKEYCGNHPGECPVSSKKKPVSTRLEWDDWVAFNSIVNKVLNRFKANANVWSLPHDVKGKMWIRKGTQARKRYDWDEKTDAYGRVVRYWNSGTPDQFES